MVKPHEITVLDGRVRLLQATDGFRTSIDAVLLAAACPANAKDSVIDLGCGVGSAGLCVLERIPDTKLTGVDIQEDHVALAKQNAAVNHKAAEFIKGDIRDFNTDQRFQHVICNPPFLEDGTHSKSPSASRAKALGHDETTLDDWITAAFNLIKGQGSFTLIHRADHIDRIIALLTPRFGAIEIIPLWPKEGVFAKRVIIRARKHSKSPAKIHAGIVLHDSRGKYTEAAENILRKGNKIA